MKRDGIFYGRARPASELLRWDLCLAAVETAINRSRVLRIILP